MLSVFSELIVCRVHIAYRPMKSSLPGSSSKTSNSMKSLSYCSTTNSNTSMEKVTHALHRTQSTRCLLHSIPAQWYCWSFSFCSRHFLALRADTRDHLQRRHMFTYLWHERTDHFCLCQESWYLLWWAHALWWWTLERHPNKRTRRNWLTRMNISFLQSKPADSTTLDGRWECCSPVRRLADSVGPSTKRQYLGSGQASDHYSTESKCHVLCFGMRSYLRPGISTNVPASVNLKSILYRRK